MEDGSNHTVNVGIKYSQKIKIAEWLKYGESINKFVQDAVNEKLDALRD